ncbi:TetR/AcrR family transcriptional regulator [Humidesulfovibrio idahonensis]
MARSRTQRDRRTEILAVAGPLFAANGYQGTSMSEIAAAVGGSKGTLYTYFPRKEALFEAVILQRTQARAAIVFEFPTRTGDLRTVLTRFGLRYLELVVDESSVTLLRLLYNEAPRFPEIGRIFHERCILVGRRQLAAYLALAQRDGEMAACDPDMAAEQFLMLCHAKVHMARMLCVQPAITADEAEEVVAAAVATFLAAHGANRA